MTKDFILQVMNPLLTDLPAQEALDRIRQFAEEEAESRLLLLVIMSHGRKESIVFLDRNVTVQEIIDALNVTVSQPKVRLLLWSASTQEVR